MATSASAQPHLKEDSSSDGKVVASPHNTSTSSIQEDGKAARKAFLKYDLIMVLPIVTMFYLLSFIDRVNIGNARVAGLQTDLGLTNHQYSIALTVTYVPYIAVEIPANLLLKRVGANIMLPTMVVAWGLVATLQGLVHNYAGLIACRFFLGLAEGGLLPGIMLLLSQFYKRDQLQLRMALVFTATSLAGAFSGLLATAILKLDGRHGHRGWAWIFILEGAFTVLFGLVSFFLLPRTPTSSRFLTEAEKKAVSAALTSDWTPDGETSSEEPFSWSQVLAAFKTPHVLFLAPAFFFSGNILFGLAFFAPTIIRSMGYGPIQTQLMSVPPYAASFVFSVTIAILSDRFHSRGYVLILASVIAAAGYILFLRGTSTAQLYGSVVLQTVGAFTSAPALSAWNVNNVQPHYKRATAIGIALVMSNAGGILSTWIFTDPPQFRLATRINLASAIGMLVLVIVNRAWLSYKNRQKAKVNSARSGEGTKVDWEREHAERRRLGDDHPRFIYTL